MNVLAVGAHFDDVDLACSGSLARHHLEGDGVYIYVATDSQYANPNGDLIRGSHIAEKEGEEAAELLGAKLIKGGHPSLFLEFQEEVNIDLIKIIEEKKIDILYTHWSGDVQHDHINLARASIHAARHVPRILMYRSNWYVSETDFKENFFVDITDTWCLKERAIKCYKSEMERVKNKWLDYFKMQAMINGYKIGVMYAEAFQVVKWIV